MSTSDEAARPAHAAAGDTAPSDIAARVLELAQASDRHAEVEVSVDRNRLALTRFANSVIHQNVVEETVGVRVRVHSDGRTTAGSSMLTSLDGLGDLVARTVAAVRVAPLDPSWPGLAPPAEPLGAAAVDPDTADADPRQRAARVRAFVDAAGGLETAGYCRTSHWEGTFANSAGQTIGGASAEAALDGIARNDGADGVARLASNRLADIDGAVLGARSATKARAAAAPIELPPGRYEVVFEPTAVTDLLQTLGLYGFNAKAVQERRSFVRLGDAQFDPAISLVDDPLATGASHDAEGTPRRRLVLVDGGTSAALTHDRRTAAAAGAEPTGHSVGAAAWGGIARHLGLVAAGGDTATAEPVPDAGTDAPAADATVAELVAGVERGLLVTDLWYTRVLDPRTLVVTGLTRNGVWLIEHGAPTRAVANFRFTQSYAQALMPGNVRGVGRASTALPGDSYVARAPRWTAPALHLAAWHFTGGASG